MAAGATAPESSRVVRLAAEAADAAQVRTLTTHPDVIALRVERVRAQVDRLLWAGIVLGLAFTAVNVQTFAAAGAPAYSLAWWVAWLLDPMVSLVLLAVLRAEQVTARYQVSLNAWARRTKWLTFAATYVMNTWTSWGLAEGKPFSAAGVVLHSVPPLVVFFTAETGPGLRDRLTEAVHRALTERAPEQVMNGVHEPVHKPGPRSAADDAQPTRPARAARRPARRAPTPRTLLADYVTAARVALDDARAAGESVDATPAWCRRVTGCSAGTSVKVAAALRAADPAPAVAPVSIPPAVEPGRAAA
ncbi:hypothetical protein HF526_27660 [Pseudonocardia sp. K10HN5]|uniref:DUF2637 domain-containing protein n=2 Tax=Pseudonocardia acidicola TaxID=2724939 RepID=A0ABX1SHK6_9PSEU|nr:hypothetical protein [Pseudonocardia acidicola]NMI01052.1 hypothetical protein [Pseudonocardia acidicola]